jgi:glutamate racemase
MPSEGTMSSAEYRPIGVFDSGVGGLTVLRAIHDVVPSTPTIYIGDLAYFPYGTRPPEDVRRRAEAITRYLVDRGVGLIVVACNTATSLAIDRVKAVAPVPVIGVVEPGVEAALKASGNRRYGVLATEGTVASNAYQDRLKARQVDANVLQIAASELVTLIENGRSTATETRRVLWDAVQEFERFRCDTIILGCTHFPLVRDTVADMAGSFATIVDSAATTARAIVESVPGKLDTSERSADNEFLTTSRTLTFERLSRNLFGRDVEAQPVDIT